MTTFDQNPKNPSNADPSKQVAPQVDIQKINSDLQAMLVRAAQSAKGSDAEGPTAPVSKSAGQPPKPA